MKQMDKLTDKLFASLYRRRLRKDYALPQRDEFGATMRYIFDWCETAGKELGPAHQVEMLDFIIRTVKANLQSSVGMDLFYAAKREPREWRSALIPFAAERYSVGRREVSSVGKTVISYPWTWNRLSHAVNGVLRDGFRSDWGDYRGAYYPELELIAVYNGLHHSFVAAQLGQPGRYKVDVYPLAGIFPYVRTDGAKWYDAGNPDYRRDVLDVRMAILYELAKKKHQLTQST